MCVCVCGFELRKREEILFFLKGAYENDSEEDVDDFEEE